MAAGRFTGAPGSGERPRPGAPPVVQDRPWEPQARPGAPLPASEDDAGGEQADGAEARAGRRAARAAAAGSRDRRCAVPSAARRLPGEQGPRRRDGVGGARWARGLVGARHGSGLLRVGQPDPSAAVRARPRRPPGWSVAPSRAAAHPVTHGARPASRRAPGRESPRSEPVPRLGQHAAQDLLDLVELRWPMISGGASWTTGSPRSSARQYRPASKSAFERKPRSSRSDSSSSKVSRVALSLTSSMP